MVASTQRSLLLKMSTSPPTLVSASKDRSTSELQLTVEAVGALEGI